MQKYKNPPPSSKAIQILLNAEVLLTELFEAVQAELRNSRGDDDDELLVAGTGILRARLDTREATFKLRRMNGGRAA